MGFSRFVCLDGKECKLEDCLNECRLKDKVNPETGKLWVEAGRCLSKRTLAAVADQRIWNGTPSTTQLLRGTRESYLTITKDFAIDPKSMMFALHGTKVHSALEQYTPDGCMSEERLFDGVSSGAFDFYSPENGGTLYDNKTYGSYAVAKTLGFTEKYVANGVYKTGEKKGQTKWKKEITPDGVKKRFDLAVQLNDYRMKLEQVKQVPVNNMVCEIIVRDGGTYLAQGRGVDKNAYLVPINKISDSWVRKYMTAKRNNLIKALEQNKLPPPCNARERWSDARNGKSAKCLKFCDVCEFCDFGKKQIEMFGGN